MFGRGRACRTDRPRCSTGFRAAAFGDTFHLRQRLGYSVQPSGQCCPVAFGPLSGPLHLRRSKLARWPLASAAQNTPLRSMSPPRGEKPGFFASLNGGSYTSAIAVDGGFAPGFSRTTAPGSPAPCPTPSRRARARPNRIHRRSACPSSDRPARWLRRTRVALAVAVGVEDERRPPLRFHLVAGLIEHLRVQPADDRSAPARPQRVIRILRKHQVMRAVAGADVGDLAVLRMVHRQVPARALDRRELRRRMRRFRLCITLDCRAAGRQRSSTRDRDDRTSDCARCCGWSRSLCCPNRATDAASSARSAACSRHAPAGLHRRGHRATT